MTPDLLALHAKAIAADAALTAEQRAALKRKAKRERRQYERGVHPPDDIVAAAEQAARDAEAAAAEAIEGEADENEVAVKLAGTIRTTVQLADLRHHHHRLPRAKPRVRRGAHQRQPRAAAPRRRGSRRVTTSRGPPGEDDPPDEPDIARGRCR